MTDLNEGELRKREREARQEYPQTVECFDAVRATMVKELVASGHAESEKRERLYRAIKILDEVQTVLQARTGIGSDAIAEWVESFATTAPE